MDTTGHQTQDTLLLLPYTWQLQRSLQVKKSNIALEMGNFWTMSAELWLFNYLKNLSKNID